jgi:hypothetical protein
MLVGDVTSRKFLHLMSRRPTVKKRVSKKIDISTPLKVYQEAKILNCKMCGTEVENCGSNVRDVTCWRCVVKMIDPPAPKPVVKPEEKRPRGWQFMNRYVSPNGTVYHKGKEVDEQTLQSAKRTRVAQKKSSKPSAKPAVEPKRKRGRPRKIR